MPLFRTSRIGPAIIAGLHQPTQNEADSLNRMAMVALGQREGPFFVLMKWKKNYEVLEAATDACEEQANVHEQIVLKST